MKNVSDYKIGVLGGGQLGKMLYQEASKLALNIDFLEKSGDFPTTKICKKFTTGDFKSYEDVLAFGQDKQVLTIEIEAVNTQALKELEAQGVKVYPQADLIELIKDKGDQKNFYQENNFPTSAFFLVKDKAALLAKIEAGELNYPFVQKARRDGYDGRGVVLINGPEDNHKLFDAPSVIEDRVAIKKELAVIVARNSAGEIKSFPAVEMAFHPTANLVEYLFSPSKEEASIIAEVEKIAEALVTKMGLIGLLAVEFFVDQNDQILINEVAPRPHNSGHHTIEANKISQYGQLVRILLDLPLGDTTAHSPAVMVNILGSEGHTGPAVLEGLMRVSTTPGLHIHDYDKELTKPFRKMGHFTVIDSDLEQAIEKANFVKEHLKVIT